MVIILCRFWRVPVRTMSVWMAVSIVARMGSTVVLVVVVGVAVVAEISLERHVVVVAVVVVAGVGSDEGLGMKRR